MVLAPGKLAAINTALVRQNKETIPCLQTGLQSRFNRRNGGDLVDLTGVVVVFDEISVPI
jgi:hypothetical protein